MTGIAFTVFIVGLILTFPIAVAMGLGAVIPGLTNPSFPANLVYIVRTMVIGVDSTPILAIPLFIFSGIIMSKGGISRKLFDVFAYFIGKRRAGMPCAVILTCLFYGAISGSGPATTAAVGAMTVPVLVELGYDKVYAGSIVSVGGGLGLIIPPSISFIMFGLATGVSVGSLFIAGIIPGIVIALFLMVNAYLHSLKYGEDTEKIAASYKVLKERGFLRIFLDGFWALLTPVIILGGIYGGIVTPTEAACISVVYALIVSLFIYKTIAVKDIWKLVVDSVKAVAPLCVLLALANAFSRVLTFAQAPQALARALSTTLTSPALFLIVLNIVLLILGMFIDGAPAILILAPMLLPVATSLGINPV
ncbi:MAG: TRAP transporter large permease, partial [Firmicutes bacterium]|nr:TRAP transporter large permease [Bacillota bacterium]